MIAADVTALIRAQLRERPVSISSHGIEVDECLVEPVLMDFEDSFNEGASRQFWLVLIEDPKTGEGYRIVFDEESGKFGLAIQGPDRDVFIGLHGTFVATIEGM